MTNPTARVRAIIAALLFATALAAAPQAHAATITPNTFGDDDTDNGNCTLREAFRAANADAGEDACAAGTGADEIGLQPGTYELSLGGTGEEGAALGDLDITDSDGVKITGNPAGSIVDANAIDRVFDVRGTAARASFDLLTITGGMADLFGGGIFVRDGSVVDVARTTLTGNIAPDEGGGIDVLGAGSTLNLSDSAIVGNAATTASGDGGGLEYDNDTTANVTNTTFSGNTAFDTGGAIEIEGGIGNFLNVTITNNSAPNQGGIVQSQADGTANLKGTILAGNTVTGAGPECNAVTSQGHNLIGDPSGCAITSQQPTDLIGQTTQLEPLADNGGPTLTHALSAGSPAIDAGPPDAPPADQRGVPRNPDIGAYERVLCGGVVVNRVGTADKDKLTGTAGRDGLLGLGGNDTLTGLKGNDGLCGGSGNDKLKAGKGNDKLLGGKGKDKLFAAKGNDTCNGAAGRDRGKGCEKEKKIP